MVSSNQTTTEALSVAIATGTPVLLWGPPGSGKSSAVRSLAEAMGMACEVVVASVHDPTDFAGLPIVSGGVVSLAPPAWARRLADAGSGVLFLDELTTAAPAVQAALLRVVLERCVGDLALPEGVRVVAAANPSEEAADGWELAAPLANRFCHLTWSVQAQAFAEGLLGAWRRPVVPLLAPCWETDLPGVLGVFAAFIAARPQVLLARPDAATAGRAWASPRTWEMAARLWAASGAAGIGADARFELVAGCVGEGAASELLGFLNQMDLPDPESLLQDPRSFKLPERADRALAVLSGVAAAVAEFPTKQRWEAGWAIVAAAAATAPDVAATAARALARCRPDGAPAPSGAAALAAVLTGAGLMKAGR